MNRRYTILTLSILTLILVIGTALFAAKKPVAKPKPKLGSIGTTQLPGDWCKLGKIYTLGKTNAMNVTLKSAEYTLSQVKIANRIFWPKNGEKLLIIHYTLHNPLPKEQRVGFTTISWTAVDSKSKNKNQEYRGVAIDDKYHTILDQPLKRVQKIDAFAVIIVDADGEVPKLMAANASDRGAPVARYDLRGLVKPLKAPYADPSDSTGATVIKKIPGTIGEFYTTGNFDVKVDAVDFATPPFEREGYDKNDVYVVVTLECAYFGDGTAGIGGSGAPTYGMELEDTDGVTYKYKYGPMPLSTIRRFDPKAELGKPAKFRVAFSVPKGMGLKSLTFKEFYGYPVVIDLSAYKTP